MKVLHGIDSTGRVITGLLLSAALGFAQSPGWRRADEPAPPPVSQPVPNPPAATPATPPNVAAAPAEQNDPSTPVAPPEQNAPQVQNAPFDQNAQVNQNGVPAGPPPATPPPNAGLPAHLTIPAGKYINVRVDQPLSTNHNQVGDFFSATLIDPIVVDGIVVAQRGQRLAGRVSEVDKGGRVSGVARLGLQLTQLTAVDGQQIPLKTTFVSRNAPSTAGRDAGVIAGTTGLGAAVGAAAGWGRGAAIGAGAGAALGIAGVLLSRGAPAVVYPETPLTFRIDQAADVDTERAPQAFQPVNPNQYGQPQTQLRTGPAPGAYGYGYPAPYAYVPYPYPYVAYPYPYYYPYYWGPSFGVVIGRGWYGGRWYRR
ncbi:MAG TPA: hypothetical protein VKV17_11820 [Bryobacteraceae bacterium]|nr:hypothetical protein [Bryobacteraceae bacterium]